jgi:hypothetical protein
MRLNRIAAAGLVTAGLALGGVGYAYAQASDTTTPPATTAPSGPSNDGGGTHSQGNCPNMGGSSSNQSSADASQTASMHHGYGPRS